MFEFQIDIHSCEKLFSTKIYTQNKISNATSLSRNIMSNATSVANTIACSDGTMIVGDWVAEGEQGQYILKSCPDGYEMITTDEAESADLQECSKCPRKLTYILRPNEDACQECPPGLHCSGDSKLNPVTVNATWVFNGSTFKLESCPYGYSAVSINHEGVLASEQQCTPCEKGRECTTPPCTACSECKAGYYKSAVSTEACVPCPENTYGDSDGYEKGEVDRTQPGYCKACPAGSDTNTTTGQTSFEACKCSFGNYQTGADSCIR